MTREINHIKIISTSPFTGQDVFFLYPDFLRQPIVLNRLFLESQGFLCNDSCNRFYQGSSCQLDSKTKSEINPCELIENFTQTYGSKKVGAMITTTTPDLKDITQIYRIRLTLTIFSFLLKVL